MAEDPRVDMLAGWMLNDRRGEGTLDGYRESAMSRLRILDRITADKGADSKPPERRGECVNCGQPIRSTTPDDGYDPEYLWTHEEGGLYCDIGTPVASPGGGYGC